VLGQVLVVSALLVVVSILCVFYVILRRPKLSVQSPFKKLGIGRHKAGDRSARLPFRKIKNQKSWQCVTLRYIARKQEQKLSSSTTISSKWEPLH
jgi:hypothetical protein